MHPILYYRSYEINERSEGATKDTVPKYFKFHRSRQPFAFSYSILLSYFKPTTSVLQSQQRLADDLSLTSCTSSTSVVSLCRPKITKNVGEAKQQ